MKRQRGKIFLAIIALFFIIMLCYELFQCYSSYIMLVDAKKTTVISMEKIISNNKFVAFTAKVNMTPSKWKYHLGTPLIILDDKRNPLTSIILNRNIEFELIDKSQKYFKIIVLNKDIKKNFTWMHEKLNLSINSRRFSPIRRLENGQYKTVQYQKGMNIIKFTFSKPIINNFDNLKAFIYFGDGTKDAAPLGYLLKAFMIGIIGTFTILILKLAIRKLGQPLK